MAEAAAPDSAGSAERMIHMMNEAMLAPTAGVGHRAGRFEVMSVMPAPRRAGVASDAGLDERYVQEWLAAMTTGRIVGHDGVTGTLSLPAGHASFLTRAAGPNNLAVLAQYVGLLAPV